MVFPTFLNLSLNLAIRSSWSEPQSTPGLVFADCIELLHFWLQKNIINLISVLAIWWRPCVESSLVLLEEGFLLWPVHSLGKTLLAFALLHSVLQGQIWLLLQVFLDFLLLHFYFCIPAPETKANIQESGNSQKPQGQAQHSGKQTYGTNNRDAENQWNHSQTASYKL